MLLKTNIESGAQQFCKTQKRDTRLLKEMKEVLYHKELADEFPDMEIYYMWRGVDKRGDLRYDITLIPPRMLGTEFIRTKGNRNSENYPELYTVLEGKALFLMQKTKSERDINIVEDAAAIKANKGDWIKIPAKYAVIIINPSKKTLKTGNWVLEKNKNIYKELEKMGGMGYFAITQETGSPEQGSRIKWVENKNYKFVPKLRFTRPLKKMPESLDFLKG